MRESASSYRLLLLLGAGLGLGGASGCQNSEEKLDPNDIAIQYAPAEMARTICTRAYDCCTVDQLMSNDAAGTTEAACERESTKSFRNTMNAVERAQQRGRLAYHGDLLATCLANIRAASCDELNRTNHLSGVDCGATYLEPKVAVGGACDMDSECMGGSCAVAEGADEGICVVFGHENDSCADGARCAAGFACDGNTHLCYATNPDGAVCTSPAQCSSGSCNASPTGGASTCGPPAPTMCFYSSGCAAAGSAPPSLPAAAVVLAAIAWAVGARRRRAGARAHRR